MSYVHPIEIYSHPERTASYKAEERYFDKLVRQKRFDDASEFIHDHVDRLSFEIREHGYDRRFFHAALKEIALPMYKKMHADETGEPYAEARTEVPQMYQYAVNLMDLLVTINDDRDEKGLRTSTHYQRAELRGNMTELTVFALAVRDMVGVEDDYTIIPSDVSDDIGSSLDNGQNTGFDFRIYDRERDQEYPLQVKTSVTPQHYHESIAVLTLSEFLDPLSMTPEQLQAAIAHDTNYSSYAVHRAARRIRNMLSSGLSKSDPAA